MYRLLLLALFVLGSGVVAQPQLGALRYLPGDDTVGPAPGNQDAPVLAAGGTQMLAVWLDYRHTVADEGPLSGTGVDLYAARLDASGAVLDPVSLPVAVLESDQQHPVVAWNGSAWLVVWTTTRLTGSIYDSGIEGVRVSASGQLLDAAPIPLLPSGAQYADLALASDGTDWLLVTNLGGGVQGHRISAAGQVLNPGGTALYPPPAAFGATNLDLDFANGRYLLSFVTNIDEWRGQRFTPTLQPVDAQAFLIKKDAPLRSPQIATNGTSFYAVWFVDLSSLVTSNRVKGSVLSATGQLATPDGTDFIDPTNESMAPQVAWDGTQWVVTYSRYPDLRASRVTTAGARVGALNGTPIYTGASALAAYAVAGRSAGGVQVVLADRAAGPTYQPYDILGFQTSGTLTAGTAAPVALGTPLQRFPDAAAGPDGLMVVYASERSRDQAILAQRLDGSGAPLGGPVTVATGPKLTTPHVAWDGSRYLVVWYDADSFTTGIWARRLDATGTPLDAAPFKVLTAQHPDVAGLDGTFLVVGTYGAVYTNSFPYALRVDGSTGTVQGPAVAVGGSFARRTTVAALADRFLVAWDLGSYQVSNQQASIFGNTVGLDGVAGTSFAIASGPWYRYDAALAWNGQHALVLWEERALGGGAVYDVYGRRLNPDGTPADAAPFLVTQAADQQIDPAVAWDGTVFHTAFGDQREAPSLVDYTMDLYGARVSAAGTALDPAGFPLSNTAPVSAHPAVGAFNGAPFYLGEVVRAEAPFATFRIGFRTTGDDDPPPPVGAVTIAVMPVGTTALPTTGGTLKFTVTLANTKTTAQTVQYWIQTTGPKAAQQGPFTATVPAGGSTSKTHKLKVKGNWPSGTYTTTASVGTYPTPVLDTDSFAWTKGTLTRSAVAAAAETETPLPDALALTAYPNPADGVQTLRLALPAEAHVRLAVYNVLGQRVALLADAPLAAGIQEVRWDGQDAAGRPTAPGVYLLHLDADGQRRTLRVTRSR